MASDVKAGGAYVELLLKDKKFLAGLQSAKTKLIGFAKGAALVGGAVAAAGAAAGAVAFRNFLTLGEELDTLSRRTGLAVESLSELRHAAGQSGVSMSDLEMAVRQMVQRGFSPEQFDSIAAAIAGIQDPTERARQAMEVFGTRAGMALVPMLQDLPALRQEARDLGFVMSGEAASSAERLGDMLSNLWETLKMGTVAIGAAFAPLAEEALPAIQAFATIGLRRVQEFAEGMAGTMRSIGQFVVDTWSTVFGWWRSAQEAAMSALVYITNNWQVLLETAMVSAELAVVRFANQTIYFFSEALPGYLSWFGDNWREVFIDIANITKTVASNIWQNLKNLWDGIVGLFSGEGFTFTWQPLTEGFESAIKELPNIAAREMGPLEKSLQDQLNGLGEKVVAGIEQHKADMPSIAAAFLPNANEFQELLAKNKAQSARGAAEVAAVTPLAGQAKRDVFSTFSASALQAAGQGGGVEDAIKKSDDRRAKENQKLIMEIRAAGGLA